MRIDVNTFFAPERADSWREPESRKLNNLDAGLHRHDGKSEIDSGTLEPGLDYFGALLDQEILQQRSMTARLVSAVAPYRKVCL